MKRGDAEVEDALETKACIDVVSTGRTEVGTITNTTQMLEEISRGDLRSDRGAQSGEEESVDAARHCQSGRRRVVEVETTTLATYNSGDVVVVDEDEDVAEPAAKDGVQVS